MLQIETRSEQSTNPFWLELARERLRWRREPTRGLVGSFDSIAERPLSWFGDGELNVTETCVDRHLAHRPDKVAILWEGDTPGDVRRISYRGLHREVCRAANALRSLGVQQGDRVILYMGMVPELAIAMLACARLGAVHSVVFGGFSADALRDRIVDSGARVVITQDVSMRGGKRVPLKATVDAALTDAVEHVVVVKRTGDTVAWSTRDVWWHTIVDAADAEHEAVAVSADHPLFILYTSGSTGRPKGLVHACAGYLAYASYTHATVFDLQESDVYACVADIGWITGHSYIVYGPLANGATTLMFESTPSYPDPGRYWEMVQRHRISIFYGAPTALRTLAAEDVDHVRRYDRSSLRVIGSVGEPIDPDSWRWYHDIVGEGRCTLVDTWWQTETGGIAISAVAPARTTKPGCATRPLPGIQVSLRGTDGARVHGEGEGQLCIDRPWPGQARTVWRDHERFVSTYFSQIPGAYFTGDGARRDLDGDYWITGRIDDVINVAGHRMGTAEFEAALNAAPGVAEVAVVGYPHPRKGQGVFAYVVPERGATIDGALLDASCRASIGAHAKVDSFRIVPGLPKTRSGKVMRRILRKLAEGDQENLGDLSTLSDPSLVDALKAAI
ncbi:MAG TPA: acetate--CoA ligase [Polyangiales bacterium]|nr:acetate--CoA ligase [Polyangiales bacterium]